MFPSGAFVNVWTFFNNCVCVWVPQLSSVWKYGSQNHTITVVKGSNMKRNAGNWRICRTWMIFLRNSAQFNCWEQTRESWTTIKTKNCLDNPGFERGYFNIFSYFLSCGLCVNIFFFVKYLTRDSTKSKITRIFYDLSYFVKIIPIFTDSARRSQTFACHCISKLIFLLVICIAKNLISTTLKVIFSVFKYIAPSEFRFSNSCISTKYCQILTTHTSMEGLFIQLSDDE